MKCLYVSEKRSENLDAECCKPEGKRSDVEAGNPLTFGRSQSAKEPLAMFHATPNEISDFPLQTSVEKNNGSTKATKSAINAALGSLPAAEALTTAGEEWLLNIEAVWL